MLEIEILETNLIEGGVEVYVRCFRDSKQIGFGKDGTVDIERFRIFNPPILVPDSMGKIVRENVSTDENGKRVVTYTNFREDPEEATLQVIEHSLSVMKNIHNDSKIIQGKRGRTTSTFYPDAGTGGTTVDGNILNTAGGNWANARSATVGTNVQDTAAQNDNFFQLRTAVIGRIVLLFDTSALAGDTLISATLSQEISYVTGGDSNSDQAINVVSASPASNSALVLADYNIANFGATRFSSDLTITSAMTSNAYRDFVLNASGLANIALSGISKFGIRFQKDLDNSDPGVNKIRVRSVYADTSGTSSDPKLVVEHSAGGSPARLGVVMMM